MSDFCVNNPTNDLYVLVVWENVDPEMIGPYRSEELRDKRAKEIHKISGDNGIYALDIVDCKPIVSNYSAAFFLEG